MTAQPGGRAPAPAHLQPVQDLLNTVNLESGEDELAAETFGVWAAARGVTDADETDRRRLQQLREDLRGWLAAPDDRVPAGVAAGVEAARLVVSVVDGRLATTSPTPLGRLVAAVVDGVQAAQRVGDWDRLKICSKHACRWAFYDHSRNNSSRWCSSAICGAREKSRRAYRRRTAGSPAAGPGPA